MRLPEIEAVLPACEWCGERPEVSETEGRMVTAVMHRRDCPAGRHKALAKEYVRAVKRTMDAMRESLAREASE